MNGKFLNNLIGGGYRGVIYPVYPSVEAVLGIQCYPDVKGLPKTPYLGVICVPAPKLLIWLRNAEKPAFSALSLCGL